MGKDGLIGPLGLDPYPTCESWLLTNMTKFPFTGHSVRATQVLDLVHTDVCGPMNETAHGGFHYFITSTNDHSSYGCMYLMENTSKALDKFRKYEAIFEI